MSRVQCIAISVCWYLLSSLSWSQVSVLTYHNDIQRTGQNLLETILRPGNVDSGSFGKVFSLSTTGNIYAQPLYMPNVTISGKGTHNVVFIATESDLVYAFDADGKSSTPLWSRSFVDSSDGITTVPQGDVGGPITPEYGITSTPVIDPGSGTMYVVAFTKESGKYVQRLHALDITSGKDKSGSPVVITASVKGTGVGHDSSGNIAFQPKIQLQRPALLFVSRLGHGIQRDNAAAGRGLEQYSRWFRRIGMAGW
jgi:hypothetical protein